VEQTRQRSLVFQLLCHEAKYSQRTQGCGLDNQSIQLPHVATTWSFGAKSSCITRSDIQRISSQAGAIAAGNACALKPSELTPAFSALLAELVPKYLDPELYAVINGAIPETAKVSYLRPAESKRAKFRLSRFWSSSGIIVRSQPSPTPRSTLIFYNSFIHRRIPRRDYRAHCRRQNIKPSYN
jgi:hypothetical protein